MAKSFPIMAFFTLFFIVGIFCQIHAPYRVSASAQDKTLEASKADASRTDKQAKTASKETTDAERVVRMQDSMKSDRTKLDELNKELKALRDVFEEKAPKLTGLKKQIDAKKQELDKIQGEGKPSHEEKLKAEIESIEKEYQNIRKESGLILEAEKTVREGIKTLNEKIEQTTQTLNRLRGMEASADKPVTSTAPAKQTEKTAPGVQQIHPVSKALEAQPKKTENQGKVASELPATAAQIEARKEAETTKEEAEKAAGTIVETVERKEALKKEIGLSRKMLDTYQKAQETNEQRLHDLQEDLTRKTAAGAGKKELQKIQKEILEIQKGLKDILAEISNRNKRLTVLNKEFEAIQEEQVIVAREAEEKRKEAEASRKKKMWLESPLHPTNIMRWAVVRGPTLITTLIAIILVLLAVRVTGNRFAKMLVSRGTGTEEEREKRANTLGSTFRGTLSGAVIIGGTLILLDEAGLDIKTLLGGAAVIGLAIAFGAQNLMRDYFNGFMILMEGQYQLNDWVQIGDVSGSVERMSMRMTTLRDLEGKAHFIPNGQIKRVTNLTHKWAQVLLDIRVTYKADTDRVMGILMEVAEEVRNDDRFGHFIIEEPVMLGVNLFADSGFEVRMVMKTRAGMQWPVKREMLRRIKNRFDKEGIEIPLPHRIVYQRLEKNEM